MGIENAQFINQLEPANPIGGDAVGQGDEHLRMLKQVLQNQFTTLGAAAVTATAAQLNNLVGSTSNIQTQLDALTQALFLYDAPGEAYNFQNQSFWLDQSDRRQWFYAYAANSAFSNAPWNTISKPSALVQVWMNRRNSIYTDSFFHTIYIRGDIDSGGAGLLIPIWRAGDSGSEVMNSYWTQSCVKAVNDDGTGTEPTPAQRNCN